MKNILVATDFSTTANNAVKFAAHYAKATKGKLLVFHCAYLPAFRPTISEAEFLTLEKNTEQVYHKKLEILVNKIYQDQGLKQDKKRVSVLARNGAFVTKTILEAGKKFRSDLIILGTHGKTELKIFGSTTSEIIFKAETPVLVIPPRYQYKKINTMVYATDFKNTINELRCILPIATPVHADIEVLNLDFGMSRTKPILDTKTIWQQLKYKKIKIIVQKEKEGLTILQQLQRYLKNRRPEVLVMFPEKRSVLDKLFIRSKTEELVYQAKLPLLTFLKSHVKQN